MPSQQDVPSAAQLLDAYGAEIAAIERPAADLHRGSGYDIHGGVGAVLFHRQAIADRDRFRATYYDTAQDLDADILIRGRYGILAARIPDLPGNGTATLTRASAFGGAGTFREGTRVSILPTDISGIVQTFEVSADTAIGASDVLAQVPIRALVNGNKPVDVTTSQGSLSLDDPTWDSAWRVIEIQCGAGFTKESDAAYKARIKALRLSQRKGYAKSISDACMAVGAGEVALFASDWGGADHGINHCFVADAGFVTTPALLTACRIAVDSVRVLGADLFVFGMTNTPLSIALTVQVWSVDQTRAAADISDIATAAVVDFFASSQNSLYWTVDSLSAVVMRQLRGDAQSVVVTPSLAEPVRSTMLDTASLPRYVVGVGDVSVTVVGPS